MCVVNFLIHVYMFMWGDIRVHKVHIGDTCAHMCMLGSHVCMSRPELDVGVSLMAVPLGFLGGRVTHQFG